MVAAVLSFVSGLGNIVVAPREGACGARAAYKGDAYAPGIPHVTAHHRYGGCPSGGLPKDAATAQAQKRGSGTELTVQGRSKDGLVLV